MNQKIIFQRIVNLREKKDWSQTKLAQKMGISKSTMSKIENGSRKLTAEELIKLSKVFDVTSDYILGLNDYPFESNRSIQYDLEILLNSNARIKYANQYILSEDEKKFFDGIISGHYALKKKEK